MSIMACRYFRECSGYMYPDGPIPAKAHLEAIAILRTKIE
jgi:hypothetical protein